MLRVFLTLIVLSQIFWAGFARASCPNLTRNLYKGLSHTEVSQLQKFLAEDSEIYSEGVISGYFGSLTETALKRWQTKYGIESVGILGPVTRAKIAELCKENKIEPPLLPAVKQNQPLFAPTVEFITPPPLAKEEPKINFKANGSSGPLTLPYGSSVKLSWDPSSHAWIGCNKLMSWSGYIPAPVKSGEEEIKNLTYTQTYILECYLDSTSYRETIVINVLAKNAVLEPAAAATTSSLAIPTSKMTCSLSVSPAYAVIGKDELKSTWNIFSDPNHWNFYWHESIDGVDQGHIYGSLTNKVTTDYYPSTPARYARYAHVVVEAAHLPKLERDSVHKTPDCTTNTAVFEVRAGASSFLGYPNLASVFEAVYGPIFKLFNW